jgi:hypothetical protein
MSSVMTLESLDSMGLKTGNGVDVAAKAVSVLLTNFDSSRPPGRPRLVNPRMLAGASWQADGQWSPRQLCRPSCNAMAICPKRYGDARQAPHHFEGRGRVGRSGIEPDHQRVDIDGCGGWN